MSNFVIKYIQIIEVTIVYLISEKQSADGTYYEMTAIDENGEAAFTKNRKLK